MERMLVLKGDNYEVGVKAGTALAKLIKKAVVYYRGLIKKLSANKPAQTRDRISRYKKFLMKEGEAYYKELVGTAKGSGIALDDIILLNFRTDLLNREAKQNEKPHECTSIGLVANKTKDGKIIVSQSWDFLCAPDKFILMIDYRINKKPRFITMAEAGMLGKIGINETGLAVNTNLLACGYSSIGMSTALLLRKSLEQESVQGVIAAVTNQQRAGTSYILCGDKDLLLGIEYTPDDYAVIMPEDGILLHTNHFLAPKFEHFDYNRKGVESTFTRIASARQMLDSIEGGIDVEDIKRILADKHVTVKGTGADKYTDWATHRRLISVPVEKKLLIANMFGDGKYVTYTM